MLSANAAGFVASDFQTPQQPPTELPCDDNPEPAPASNVVREEAQRLELVFVDANTPDANALTNSLVENADDNRSIEAPTLDAHRDGTWQITRALAAQREVVTVHVTKERTVAKRGASSSEGDEASDLSDSLFANRRAEI